MLRPKKNLLELRNGIVHADGADGNDYTLCGVTAERVLKSIEEYTEDECLNETETEPCMIYTDRKIDCETCATIILHCCRMGEGVISKAVLARTLKEEV